jgi:cullin 1
MAAPVTPIISWENGWDMIKREAIDPLERILDLGIDKQSGRLFSNEIYMTCYTQCYNMCTQRQPHNWAANIYEHHALTIEEYLNTRVLVALDQKNGPALLHELSRRWKEHNIMNKWLKNFFAYVDRYYIVYQHVPPLLTNGLAKFKEIVFDSIKDRLADAIIVMINDEREGSEVDQDLIRSAISLFEAMGMQSLEQYETGFENKFLDATREYYIRKTANWIESDPTPQYLIKMEMALEDEKNRVNAYLNISTMNKVMKVLEVEGLEKRQTDLLEKEGSGCRVLLIDDKRDDLHRMYNLFKRLTNGLDMMATMFKEHIIKLGSDKMDARMARFNEEGRKETNNDPEFVKSILALHSQYTGMVTEIFGKNVLFQQATFKAFTHIVNNDQGKIKNSDLFATFSDRILKNSDKLDDKEVEDYLEKVVHIFKYLTDKDVFAEIYRNQLAKRLLNNKSTSDEMEIQMISKLKKEGTPQFTSKMEGMMNDLRLGTTHQSEFQTHFIARKEQEEFSDLAGMDFSVQVLTQGHWPTYRTLSPSLPIPMQKCKGIFEAYFCNHEANSKKRLAWQWTLGQTVVKAVFNTKGSYLFTITTLQAAVLHIFNDTTSSVSFTTLRETMSIEEDVIKKVLHSFVYGKYKVILRDIGASDEGKPGAINTDDSFRVNTAFRSSIKKINIPMPSLEENYNPKRLDTNRAIQIEAAIVRIMKARKTLTHNQLVSEVLQQMTFFSPSARDIKKYIESLIEREYLERDDDNNNIYKYLA